MKKTRWLRLLFVIPLICLLVGTNIYEDPANIYHDESKEIARAIAGGKAAYSASGNGNEREVKHNLIMLMPDEVDCVAVGPSLVMGVNKEITGAGRFFNLGVSGSNLYDILAQFGLMDIYGKKTKRVIFCVDAYFFNEAFYASNNLPCVNLMPYSDYMLEVLKGNKPQHIEENKENPIKTKIEQAFSISYFQASRDQVLLNHTYIMSDYRWGIIGPGFDGSKPFYGTDASWTYAKSYQDNGVEFVLEQCKKYDIDVQFVADKHISQYSKEVFEKLIAYLLDQGVEIQLFLCPLAPGLWDRIEKDKNHYPILDEISVFAEDISSKYELNIIGSYNPYELGMSNKDFYDARHIRRELLGKYFDFDLNS